MLADDATLDIDPVTHVLEMVARMEALAVSGEWAGTEQLAECIKAAVLEVPENDRRRVVTAVAHGLERVQTQVLSSRNEVTEKLSAIRRGRVARRAYGQPDGAALSASLS